MSWPVGVDLLRQVMQQILTNNVQIYLLFPHRTMRLSLTKLTYRKPASLFKQFGRWEISCWSVSLRLHKSRKIDPLSMYLHCSQPDANSTLISTRTECFLSFFIRVALMVNTVLGLGLGVPDGIIIINLTIIERRAIHQESEMRLLHPHRSGLYFGKCAVA